MDAYEFPQLFEAVRATTLCPFARRSRIVGSEPWVEGSIDQHLDAAASRLARIAREGEEHRIDGLVVEMVGPGHGGTLADLCRTVRASLRYLSSIDPAGERCMEGDIEDPRWQFSFAGARFFLSTFAPCYPAEHPRHSPLADVVFLLFQPEYSFDLHIPEPAGHPSIDLLKQSIRSAFRGAGRPYDHAISVGPLQAHKYVKPIAFGAPPVAWWKDP